jgi:hypothetical protein
MRGDPTPDARPRPARPVRRAQSPTPRRRDPARPDSRQWQEPQHTGRADQRSTAHRTQPKLCEDRILEVARTADGDPLHIAAMFGLTAKPALRYAKTIWPEQARPI